MNMNKYFLVSAFAATAYAPFFVSAHTVDEELTSLSPLLITAGHSPIEQDKSGRSYTVISAETLQQNQYSHVSDALRHVPGFHVSTTGATGGFTQLRVRGAEGNHVLVLVDGVEISAVGSGEYDFGGMLVTDIERIEVLRGPQSAFWGSNATAGVVNIITQRGDRDGWHMETRGEVGTAGDRLGGVSIRGGADQFDAAVSATYRKSDGFNISDFGSEKDGDENLTLTSKVNIDLTEHLVIDVNGRLVDHKNESDDQDFAFPSTPTQGLVIDTDNETDTRELSGSVGATWKSLDGTWTHVARVSGHSDRAKRYTDGIQTSGSEGDRLKGILQSTYVFNSAYLSGAKHAITAGYEWQRERFNALEPVYDATQLDTQRRTSNALVTEYRGEFGDQLFLNAALRRDLNDAFEDATTYSVAVAWQIPNMNTRLHSSVGSGITNPTFFEQFGFIPASFVGNPDLLPEESVGWDIGIEQKFFNGDLIVDLTYFKQNLTNEISTIYLPSFESTPVNLAGESKRQGIELSVTAQLFEGVSATGMYSYIDAIEPNGNDEVRRPKHSGSLNVAYTTPDSRSRLFGEVVFNGEMEDLEFINATPQARVTLDDYVVMNVGASYKVTETTNIYAHVQNALDESYEEVFGFNTPGFTAFVGLKASF